MEFCLGLILGTSVMGVALIICIRRVRYTYEARIESRDRRIRSLVNEIEERKAQERRDIMMRQMAYRRM